MNKKQELNAFVKECITKALIQLMQTNSFDEITISELVATAGVGRVSFYRNFESKKDVLTKHLDILLQEWAKEFEKLNDPTKFSESLIIHFYQNKDYYLLLYKHKLSDLIYEAIRSSLKLNESQNNIERYVKSMISGMIFGWVDEWMRLGMPESPEELSLLTSQTNK